MPVAALAPLDEPSQEPIDVDAAHQQTTLEQMLATTKKSAYKGVP